MLFKCKYVNNVPTVVPLANMSDNITDNASQVSITDTHGISGSVGAVTDLQTLTNTGSQKAMNNLAELMNNATAPKNYAVGDHILRNGQYSRVKQAIQSGDSFTSSNLEAACIGDELSTINSDLSSVQNNVASIKFYPESNSKTISGWSQYVAGFIIGFMQNVGSFVGIISGTTYTHLGGANVTSYLSPTISGTNLILASTYGCQFTMVRAV